MRPQALVQLRSGVSTRKVIALMGMSQSSVAYLRRDAGGEIKRQKGGCPKLLVEREKSRCVTSVTKRRLQTTSLVKIGNSICVLTEHA